MILWVIVMAVVRWGGRCNNCVWMLPNKDQRILELSCSTTQFVELKIGWLGKKQLFTSKYQCIKKIS
jgi:hypothetical protein